MIKAQSKNTPIYKTVRKMVEAKNAASLTNALVRWGSEEDGTKKQLILALTIQQAADDINGANAIPSLADEILVQQSHKVERYGDKAYPLSEKQIAVIVSDVC